MNKRGGASNVGEALGGVFSAKRKKRGEPLVPANDERRKVETRSSPSVGGKKKKIMH